MADQPPTGIFIIHSCVDCSVGRHLDMYPSNLTPPTWINSTWLDLDWGRRVNYLYLLLGAPHFEWRLARRSRCVENGYKNNRNVCRQNHFSTADTFNWRRRRLGKMLLLRSLSSHPQPCINFIFKTIVEITTTIFMSLFLWEVFAMKEHLFAGGWRRY